MSTATAPPSTASEEDLWLLCLSATPIGVYHRGSIEFYVDFPLVSSSPEADSARIVSRTMKIIRAASTKLTPRRRQSGPPPPKRKALLIGINYATRPPVEGYCQLDGAHRDAQDFRQLLIEVYGYAPADIRVMMDDGRDVCMQPRKANILREMRRLVRGAQPDDRFVFFYAGHSDQIPCRDHSEDDGMDEVLLPADHVGLKNRNKLIVDNDLRKILVNPLPNGACLTAVFDSCHSATLMDLDHYLCNNIYRPWISKGERKTKTLWRQTFRKGAALICDEDKAASRPSSVEKAVQLKNLALPPLKFDGPWDTKAVRMTPATTSALSPIVGKLSKPLKLTLKVAEKASSAFSDLMIPQTMSPVSTSRECNGFCQRTPRTGSDCARVISLSACADRQIDWEDKKGGSMTQVLIKYLKGKRNPTLNELMTFLTYHRYEASRNVHKCGESMIRYRKKLLAAGNAEEVEKLDQYPLELVNFQDPQLGSLEKLNMDDLFTL